MANVGVKYPGVVIHRKMENRTVLACERIMKAAGCRKRKPVDYFGWRMYANVKAFQKKKGIHVTGSIDELTWSKMQPYFRQDAYARWLVRSTPTLRPEETKRDLIVKNAWFGYAHRYDLHYSQTRPIPHTWRFPMYTDCSGFATLCYELAHAPDPNGFRYDGYGFTGTLMENGSQVIRPGKGDLVFYGNPDHVAVYVGSQKVISFGSEDGPYLLDINYRVIQQIRSYL